MVEALPFLNLEEHGVAPPAGAFISLCVQRNEAKKDARPACTPLAGSLHFIDDLRICKNSGFALKHFPS